MTTTATQAHPTTGLPPQFALLQLITGHWAAMAVQTAAELGIADELDAGPVCLEQLAERTRTSPDLLARLVRALATLGVFDLSDGGEVSHTALSAPLSRRHPASVGAVARMFGSDWHHRSWQHLSSAVRTGQPAFELAHHTDLVSFLSAHESAAERFDAGMAVLAGLANPALRAAMSELDRDPQSARGAHLATGPIVAISSGHSPLPLHLAADVATTLVLIDDDRTLALWRRRHSDELEAGRLRCLRVDLPNGLAVPLSEVESCRFVLLDRVLHDWPDPSARQILADIRAAAPADARVVVVEQTRTDGDPRTQLLDLQMFVHRGGAERSIAEVAELAAGAGYALTRVVPTYSPMTVLVLDPDPELCRLPPTAKDLP